MPDHPDKPGNPVSTGTLKHSALTDVARRAEKFRAKLTGSVKALGVLASSRLSDVRERVSPDMLRREASVLVRRLQEGGRFVTRSSQGDKLAPLSDAPRQPGATDKGAEAAPPNLMDSSKAMRLRAASSLAELRRRPEFGALLPALHRVTRLRVKLLVTGADIGTLSEADAGGKPAGSKEPPQPVPEVVNIAAALAPTVVQESMLEITSPAAELGSLAAAPPPRGGKVQASRPAQADVLSRLRNDVLVRTALERPVLAGAAAIAAGAVLAALSSAGRAQRLPTSAQPSPSPAQPEAAEAEADNTAGESRRRSRKANETPSETDDDTAPSGKARAPKRGKPRLANGGSAQSGRASDPLAEAAAE